MPMKTAERRREWMERLFPGGVPRLWCPLLTHYTPEGGLDRGRMRAHLAHLAPRVKGYLIPGSTGDGWEMDEAEIREVLDCALDAAARHGLRVLIGVLRTETETMLRSIHDTLSWLQQRTATADPHEAMARSGVCGFTVCPPKGADLPQAHIHDALAAVLAVGVPVALYQLPQVTGNEMAPETVAALAARYPHFVLLKDTSGADRVACSGADLGGVFLVRGAEDGYARWLRGGGGPYDGFLLSTTNCFSRELETIIRLLDEGRADEAGALSQRLSSTVADLFQLVAGLPDGNQFANAGKAADHFFAHGPQAATVPPPRLHAGSTLPPEVISQAGAVLSRYGFLPARGYLE